MENYKEKHKKIVFMKMLGNFERVEGMGSTFHFENILIFPKQSKVL